MKMKIKKKANVVVFRPAVVTCYWQGRTKCETFAAKLTGYGIDIKSESDIEEAIDSSEESDAEDGRNGWKNFHLLNKSSCSNKRLE